MRSGHYRRLTDEQLQELHEICERFAKQAGVGNSTIEGCVQVEDEVLREALFSELLEIELTSRLKGGDELNIREYHARFPTNVKEVDEVWREVQSQASLGEQETLEPVAEPLGTTGLQPESSARLGSGTTIGPYRLLQPIGQGGMGTVWKAEQREPVRRSVALKIIKAGMDSREVIARFEAERQALAMMDHPNIAKVLDAGTTLGERPYFVMELVKGQPITTFCNEHHLSPGQRLTLFIMVCKAVQHAHQKGIIHRDIKPSNVMVAMHDGQSTAKVIDFGLAKATGQHLTEKTLFTALGQLVGTPTYMSPEQADGGSEDIDTRTDVYSLGVLLYELLTGDTPISMDTIRGAGIGEMQRLIREHLPLRMSARLSSLGAGSKAAAENCNTDSRRLNNYLRGDLDLIVMKALEKDRERRYDTPSQFAGDIERFLRNEVVEARAPSIGYRLRQHFRRHKSAVLAGASVLVILIASSIVSSWLAYRATVARDDEREQREIADGALLKERAAKAVAEKRLGQLEKVNDIIGSVFQDLDPKLEERGGPPLRIQLLSRLNGLSDVIQGDAIGDPLMVSKMQLTLGIAQDSLGDQQKAIELLKKALTAREKELGVDHLDTLKVRVRLGDALLSTGEHESAVDMLQLAVDQLEKQLGRRSETTLECMSLLAVALANAGERRKGFEMQQRAFGLVQETSGERSELALEVLDRLAGQQFRLNTPEDDRQAKELFERLVKLRQETKGPEHHLTLDASSGFASALLALHEEDAAIDLYESILAGHRNQLGAEHYATLLAQCSLAYAYNAAGRKEEGFPILETCIPKLAVLRGSEDPVYMNWLNLLAYSFEQHDQLEKAIQWHEQALELRKKKLGESHPDTLDSFSNLGYCNLQHGNYADAIKYYGQAESAMRDQYAEDHIVLAGFVNNFAQSLFMGEEYAKTVPLLREVIPNLETHLGGSRDSWKVQRAQYWLGVSQLRLGEIKEAESLLLGAHSELEEVRDNSKGNAPRYIVKAAEALIELYSDRKGEGDEQRSKQWQTVAQNEKRLP